MKAFRDERGLPRGAGWLVSVMLLLACQPVGSSLAVETQDSRAAQGWKLLRSRAYLPPDFDQEIFDELWTTWEQPLRGRAEKASPQERHQMAMQRYGLLPDPENRAHSLQYVVDKNGLWIMSCLACHQGQVNGRTIPGLPNTNYALETLTEDVRLVKVRQRKPFGQMDIGSLFLPLGTTNGTTNAVMFGVALMRHRNAELEIVPRAPRFDLIHHDMDAPPWWHYQRRTHLYADGFAPKGHRMLMQFLLVKENEPATFRQWEDDFRMIESWLQTLKPPRWPWAIDRPLADKGRGVFGTHCATCHGRYESPVAYPEKMIAIDEVGTDRTRFKSLTVQERLDLNQSWFGNFNRETDDGRANPIGYVAPPLDGLWASAPYLHNGSVATLWHILHPTERPTVWQRTPTGYDQQRVGLEITEFQSLPPGKLLAAERRTYFDTSKPGKSAAGHDFPDALDEEEKAALLEYLKTL